MLKKTNFVKIAQLCLYQPPLPGQRQLVEGNVTRVYMHC